MQGKICGMAQIVVIIGMIMSLPQATGTPLNFPRVTVTKQTANGSEATNTVLCFKNTGGWTRQEGATPVVWNAGNTLANCTYILEFPSDLPRPNWETPKHPCFPKHPNYFYARLVRQCDHVLQGPRPHCSDIISALQIGICPESISPRPRPLLIDCGPSPFDVRTLNSLTHGWRGTCRLYIPPHRTKRESKTDPDTLCTPCIVTTKTGNQIAQTLKFHSALPDVCSNPYTCVHNNTRYTVCENATCHQPQANGLRAQVWVYGYKGGTTPDKMLKAAQKGQGLVATHTMQQGGKTPLTVCFDACKAVAIQKKKGTYGRTCGDSLAMERSLTNQTKFLFLPLVSRRSRRYSYYYAPKTPHVHAFGPNKGYNFSVGLAPAACQRYNCNPVCLHFGQSKVASENTYTPGFGIQGIQGPETNPYGKLIIRVKWEQEPLKEHSLFWSFYERLAHGDASISGTKTVVKNLFLGLAEGVAATLNVNSCYVCGGTNMGEQWPWEALEIDWQNRSLGWTFNFTTHRPGTWTLGTSLVGKNCFSRPEGLTSVGSLTCEAMWQCENNQTVWWSGQNLTQPNITHVSHWSQLSPLLNLCDSTNVLQAPDSLYWICGKWAYAQLPANWTGTCVMGSIRPGFFLLPLSQGPVLGVPVYDNRGEPRLQRAARSKRTASLQLDTAARVRNSLSANILQVSGWAPDEWPPARIISYYGPATWAQDGTYGYRTP
uniref:Uncharacterized protein n=1 Tax=Pelusios castaneus TaxID=367368 RepID=A0A8C8SMV8_9SAUR